MQTSDILRQLITDLGINANMVAVACRERTGFKVSQATLSRFLRGSGTRQAQKEAIGFMIGVLTYAKIHSLVNATEHSTSAKLRILKDIVKEAKI